jgi:hypothetical protein
VSIADQPEYKLRKALTEVRLAPAYHLAVEKGIATAVATWPAADFDKQLATARRIALKELARYIGWEE